MVYSWEVSKLAQSAKQLIELMAYYTDKGDLTQARKIMRKLWSIDSARLKELATIDIDATNYRAVMGEIDQIGKITELMKVSE